RNQDAGSDSGLPETGGNGKEQVGASWNRQAGYPPDADSSQGGLGSQPCCDRRRRQKHVEKPRDNEAQQQFNPDAPEKPATCIQPFHRKRAVLQKREYTGEDGQRE